MARSKRGRRPPSAAADRDAATVQAVNALLLEPRSPVGVRCRQRSLLPLPCRHRHDASFHLLPSLQAILTRLRKIAAIRGLVTDAVSACLSEDQSAHRLTGID